MTVEIDSMRSHVEIRGSRDQDSNGAGAGHSASAAPASAVNSDQLKEVLRPIVLELLSEELESYMRMRG